LSSNVSSCYHICQLFYYIILAGIAPEFTLLLVFNE